MVNLLKVTLLFFILAILISCNSFNYCPTDDSKNLGNNLELGIYYSKQEEGNGKAKEVLILHEDSSFAYFAIANDQYNNYGNDTIKKIIDGKFSIYQDSGFSWYVLELKSDSIYERQKTEAGYTDFFLISKWFNGLSNEFISDINSESSCFSLAYKQESRSDEHDIIGTTCDIIYLREHTTFCMEQ